MPDTNPLGVSTKSVCKSTATSFHRTHAHSAWAVVAEPSKHTRETAKRALPWHMFGSAQCPVYFVHNHHGLKHHVASVFVN